MSISTEGRRGRGAGFVAAFVVVFVFAGAWVKECFWVGASFILCFFASNFFLFHSTSGSPLVVTFVESLRLRGPEASGESVGIGSGCGMWFWDVVQTNVDTFLQCFFFFCGSTPQVLYSRKVCHLHCRPIFCWAVPNTHWARNIHVQNPPCPQRGCGLGEGY